MRGRKAREVFPRHGEFGEQVRVPCRDVEAWRLSVADVMAGRGKERRG